jgi:hypothetical protein
LKEVIWLTRPKENIRHIYYYGYHNDDPKQMFQCWLPANRVLEEPPEFLPVLLCYKLNGEWLSGKRGGPVRMLVPESYGFKSVKWLQRVVLTNSHQSNDTYANGNNDINDSWLKTMARFADIEIKGRAGRPIAITGIAQVGISGLAKVQYFIQPKDAPLPPDDPNLATAAWQDAEILPPPDRWPNLPDGKLPDGLMQFDASGRPRQWPLRFTIAHWAVLAPPLAAGKYDVRCRTIDLAGHAQPLPRPFAKSGRNQIQRVTLNVER